MTLRGFLAKRIIYTIILVFFVIVLNFMIFEAMPGQAGVLYSVIGTHSPNAEDQYKALVRQYHLNDTIQEKFVAYVQNMLTFNFGYSYYYHIPVIDTIISSGRLGNTLILLGSSTILSIVIGVFLGIIISRKRGSAWDNFWVTSSLTAFALPVFFIGILLIFLFVFTLHWAPPGNVIPFEWTQPNAQLPPLPQQIFVRLQYLFLPSLTLTLIFFGNFLLLTRATMVETLSEDYITTAKAKGLRERTILFKHAFKNASLPIVTATALAFGSILGGAIITETLFNWDGLGLMLFNSVLNKDFPVMQALFFIIALSVIIANFISDIVYGVIDPRIKYE